MPATQSNERDQRHLERAVDLAAEARGRTGPNPLVGAVVVKSGRGIGGGFHAAAGTPHAERVALGACTEDPAGATMYVSLEPCAHTGCTPPCTEAILEAGITRGGGASDDPTEKVSGRGLGGLRDEGVEVASVDGAVARSARLVNQPFRKHARTGCPHVVLKLAMTLDGKVATRTGDSRWISGEASRARVHRWRSDYDAVAVGLGTALADDPLLTTRLPDVSDFEQPLRVVFDSEARLPLDGRLVKGAGGDVAPVLVVSSRAASHTAIDKLRAAGAEVLVVTGQNEASRVGPALRELGSRGVQSLLLEGGPRLAGAFLDAGE